MNETIHIAGASDERYFPGLLATLTSILVNSRHQQGMAFHIIDGGIKPHNWRFLENSLKRFSNVAVFRYSIDQSHFEKFPEFFYDSKMAYARLLLPSLLSVEKVIYVDSDILFLKDISLLWEMEFDGNAAMAALEASTPYLKDDCPLIHELKLNAKAPYFNSGIIYLDLEKFRNEDISTKTMQYLKEHPDCCRFWDQSALNITLYNNFKLLDQSWNTQSHRMVFKLEERFHDFQNHRLNYHFVTSFKPWLSYNESLPNRLFYTLLDEIGYCLKDSAFINSKRTYRKKLKLGRLLPMLYYLRSFKKKLSGHYIEAQADRKVAQFWQEQLGIIAFHKKEDEAIRHMEREWRKNIRKARQTQVLEIQTC